MKKIFCSTVISLLCCTIAYSQDEMHSDRPDQTEEASVLKPGTWQIEAGALYNRFDSGRAALIARGLIRYGLSKRVELRLLAEQGRERDRYSKETVQSTYPLALSTKIALVEEQKGWLPAISLIGYLNLPVNGTSPEATQHWSPAVILAFANELNKQWKLEYNAGWQQEAFSHEHAWLVNASLHYKAAEKTELFGGYFSQFQRGEDPLHNIDAGVQYSINDNLQVDLAGGTSIGAEQGNQFVTAGVAVRLPNKHHR